MSKNILITELIEELIEYKKGNHNSELLLLDFKNLIEKLKLFNIKIHTPEIKELKQQNNNNIIKGEFHGFEDIEKYNYKINDSENEEEYPMNIINNDINKLNINNQNSDKLENFNFNFNFSNIKIKRKYLNNKEYLTKFNNLVIEVLDSTNPTENGFYKILDGHAIKIDKNGMSKCQRKKLKYLTPK